MSLLDSLVVIRKMGIVAEQMNEDWEEDMGLNPDESHGSFIIREMLGVRENLNRDVKNGHESQIDCLDDPDDGPEYGPMRHPTLIRISDPRWMWDPELDPY